MNSNLFSTCCGAQPKPYTEIGNYNEGMCPECHDWTVFEVSEEESNQDKICGGLNAIFGKNGILNTVRR